MLVILLTDYITFCLYAILFGMDNSFVKPLLSWFENHARDLPWRHTKNPYAIWVSEIMLQQTRVEAVKGYYERFLLECPDISSLADIPEDKLMKLWEGLGYYSRARNLKKAAEKIQSNFSGSFPSTYETILSLPGIGPYTAGAIGSIAFSLPVPAVDGNVLRVFARLNQDARNILDDKVKNDIRNKLLEIIPEKQPGTFNQALMELGATVCLPTGTPLCADCPLSHLCKAHLSGKELQYPVRSKQKNRTILEKTIFVLYNNGKPYGFKRPSTGLLASMYQYPEQPGFLSDTEIANYIGNVGLSPSGEIQIAFKKHIFSHIEWHMKVCVTDVSVRNTSLLPKNWMVLDPDSQSIPTAFLICSQKKEP